MSNVYAELITNTVKSLNSHVGEGLSTSGGTLHVDALASESDGTVRGGIAELTAKGHAEQVSTTGKNLLPNTASSNTINGVALTVNSDGSITAKGTLSSAFNFRVGQTTLAAGTYTLSGCPSEGSYSNYVVRLEKQSDNSLIALDTGSGAQFTLSESTGVICRLYVYASIDETFYPMLELGSTATEYEPYTGGAPSPSPDYPQEIQVVRGRNLCPYLEQGYWAFADGGSSSSAYWVRTPKIGCDPDMDYTVTSEYVTRYAGFVWYDKNGQYISTDNTGSGDNRKIEFKAKSPSNAAYMAFDVQGANGGSPIAPNDIKDLQINAGSTPQPYVPYGHVGMEVQGRNLWKWARSAYIDANGNYVNANNNAVCSPIACNAGDVFTFSFEVSSASNCQYAVFNSDGTFAYRASASVITTPLTFTVNNTGTLVFWFANTGNDGTEAKAISFKPQLTLGSTATPYEPYYHITTPIPLPSRGWVAGLPDGTADSLRLDGAGKCEWTLPTSMETFDGSSDESWNNMESARIQHILLSSSAVNSAGMFTHAIRDNITSINGQFNVSANRLFFNAGFSSVDSMRALLEAHPASLLYKLATPVTEDMGYIDMPSIPSDVTITIPELDNLNIKYMVGNTTAKDYAEQWYDRAKAVEIAPVEDAVADLASVVANLVTHDQFYFGYDEVNGKKMISIFKRGDI